MLEIRLWLFWLPCSICTVKVSCTGISNQKTCFWLPGMKKHFFDVVWISLLFVIQTLLQWRWCCDQTGRFRIRCQSSTSRFDDPLKWWLSLLIYIDCFRVWGMNRCGSGGSDKVLSKVCGTPDYTAPEMIQKKKYGFSVDMWFVRSNRQIFLIASPNRLCFLC